MLRLCYAIDACVHALVPQLPALCLAGMPNTLYHALLLHSDEERERRLVYCHSGQFASLHVASLHVPALVALQQYQRTLGTLNRPRIDTIRHRTSSTRATPRS